MKTFSISIYGFVPESFAAETKAKAFYRAFVAFRSAGSSESFREFLDMATIAKTEEVRS